MDSLSVPHEFAACGRWVQARECRGADRSTGSTRCAHIYRTLVPNLAGNFAEGGARADVAASEMSELAEVETHAASLFRLRPARDVGPHTSHFEPVQAMGLKALRRP